MTRLSPKLALCAALLALSGLAAAAHHEGDHAPGGQAPAHRSDQGTANSNAQSSDDADRGAERAAERRSDSATDTDTDTDTDTAHSETPEHEHGDGKSKGH